MCFIKFYISPWAITTLNMYLFFPFPFSDHASVQLTDVSGYSAFQLTCKLAWIVPCGFPHWRLGWSQGGLLLVIECTNLWTLYMLLFSLLESSHSNTPSLTWPHPLFATLTSFRRPFLKPQTMLAFLLYIFIALYITFHDT